jgi:sugar lactone lactonase YvrE
MKIPRFSGFGLLLLVMLALLSTSAQAEVVLYDHFNDGALDPAWVISFNNATGWSFMESGSRLNVTDINSAGEEWSAVNLARRITPLADFNINFHFSWESENTGRAMQNVLVQLYDNLGNKMAEAGYSDGWITAGGSKYAMAGGAVSDSVPDTLPLAGTAQVNLVRSGSNINVLWDGTPLLSGIASAPLARVALVFSYRNFSDLEGPGVFGSEAVDLIEVSGSSPTPNFVQYLLAATQTTPGGGNPGEVFLFSFPGIGTLTPLPAIPSGLTESPNYVAFSPTGELFVSNHNSGTVSRFTIDSDGNYFPTGTITGNNLEAPHGLAFSSTGELFAANWMNGTISRFTFDGQGNLLPNGTIATGGANQGLAFSSNGELFSTGGSNIRRFTFDSGSGPANLNGTITVSGTSALHGLAFNGQGELFIADPYNNRVVRYKFDNTGNAISNGEIAVSGGPIDVAFSPTGELFVSCHFSGGLQRFLFDPNGEALPNGTYPSANLGGVAIFNFERLNGGTFVDGDLTGTWHFQVYGDAVSANAPYWGSGTMNLDPTGAVASGTAVNDSGVVKTVNGGSFAVDDKGQVSGTLTFSDGTVESLPLGKMDNHKKILAMVGSDPTYRHLFIAEKGGGTFNQSALAGTWHFQVFEDNPSINAPYWASGTMILDGSGNVIGGTAVNDSGIARTFTGGALIINSAGQVSGTLAASGGVTGTISHGKLSADKTFLTMLSRSSSYRGMFVMAKGGGSFSQSDLAGTWYLQVLADSPSSNAPYWGAGTMILDMSGRVIGGTAINDSGVTKTFTGGSFTIDGAGEVTGTTTLSDGSTESLPRGKLDASKTILAMVNSDPTYRGLFVAIKGETAGQSSFTDVSPGYWAYGYIMDIYNAGITAGCSQNPLMYCPENGVTREEMATFIIRSLESEPPANYCDSGAPFTDVTDAMWSCRFIKRLKELGITGGYPDGSYRPYELVNREQMAVFLVRAVEGGPALNYCDSGDPFIDVTAGMWSCGFIKRLKELGISTGYGDGRYGPNDVVTRAQMAVFLSRAFPGM